MTLQSIQTNTYFEEFGRCLFNSIEEVIGTSEMQAILKSVNQAERTKPDLQQQTILPVSFDNICEVQSAIEDNYGVQCGQGILLRIGRAFFNFILRDFSPQIGFTDPSFRFLPMRKKIKAGLERLAVMYNQFLDQPVCIKEEDQYYWVMERCPLCWNKRSSQKSCAFMVGFLQEAMYWLSGGRQFRVEEIDWAATGNLTCTMQIKKQPYE